MHCPHADAQQNFQIFLVGFCSRSINYHFVPCCKKSKNMDIFLSMSNIHIFYGDVLYITFAHVRDVLCRGQWVIGVHINNKKYDHLFYISLRS